MTIEVPPDLAPQLDRLVAELAQQFPGQPKQALRRLAEVSILTRGMSAMRGASGSLELARDGEGGVR